MKLKNCEFALVTAIALLATPTYGQRKATETASEQDATASAQKYMDEGAALYAKADWAGAHVAFMKAWEIVQHRAIATNLADVELRLGLYIQASERLKFLISTLPGDHKEDIATLEAQLAECRQHATSLRISTDVEDAVVRVNGRVMGKVETLGELIVEPGPAVVEVSRPGYRDVKRNLYLASGDAKTLDFVMEPLAVPPKPKKLAPVAVALPPPPPPPESNGHGTRNLVALGGLTLTVAAGVVGVVYWRKRENSLDEVVDIKAAAGITRNGCYPGHAVDVAACNKVQDTLARSDKESGIMAGAFITAGALGVATVVTYLVWPTKKTPARTAIAPWSTASGGGVTLAGSF